MKHKEKISVIIPMFNAASTIGVPLESLARQDFCPEEIEAVLVDDGSTDNTVQVARSFLERVRFSWKIVEANHQGVSCARNAGIENAAGEYVFFLDADDQLPPDFLSTVFSSMERKSADLAWIWKVFHEKELRKLARHSISKTEDGPSCLLSYLKKPWNAQVFVRRSLLDGCGIRYCPGLKYAEDVDFFVRLLLKAQRVHVETATCYLYRRNPHQVTRTINRIEARKAADRTFHQLSCFLEAQNAPFEIIAEMKRFEARSRLNLLRELWKNRHLSKFFGLMESAETKEILTRSQKGFLSPKWIFRAWFLEIVFFLVKRFPQFLQNQPSR